MAGFYSCLKSNNDCIMATGPVDILEPLEAEETGKKKSKFQTFKNFFAKKKKKKEPSPLGSENTLKPSQSSGDVSTPHLDSSMGYLPVEPGSKGSMGHKALSHDSIFILESLSDTAGETPSQESCPGKVKALQLQFQQNIPFRSPPLVIASKKTEDTGAISEDDGLPRSPPEISTLHEVLTSPTSKSSNPVQRHSSLSLGGTDSEDDQVPSEASSRPVSPLSPSVLVSPISPTCRLLPVDFNTPASPLGCLDTSAARHKIALNPRKQKVFSNKTPILAVEKLEKEECCLRGVVEGKASPPEALEHADWPNEDSEGSSTQNTNHLIDSWINNAVPKTRTSNPLRYSRNFLPGSVEICTSAPGECSIIGTDFQKAMAVSCPVAESPVVKTGLKTEEQGVEMLQCQTDGHEQNPQSTGKEESEISEPLQAETEAVVLCNFLFPSSHSGGLEKNLDLPAEPTHVQCPKRVDEKAKGTDSSAIQVDGAQEKTGNGNSSVALGSDSQLYIPQFSSSASSSETPSETGKSIVPGLEKSPAVKDDAAAIGHPPFEDCLKPTMSLQSAMLDANLDSAEVEKPSLPTEFCCSVLNSDLGSQETEPLIKAYDSAVQDKITSGTAAVAPESAPPNKDAREYLPDSMKIKEENRSPDEIAKTQLKSSSTKPVRFTVAPAWQRSLSGGSNSLDGLCPRSSPSSPVKPEFFEGIPDTATPGCIPNNLERPSEDNINAAAMECPKVDPQSCETPFGIKLRRTSSLLKYQTEQQHHEPPKPYLLAPSSISAAKDKPKSPEPGKRSQNLTSRTKSLVMKSSFQEEKNTSKAKSEEVTEKQQMSRLPEKTAPSHPETAASEPAWISVAKLKQRGFQGLPVAQKQKKEEKALAHTETEEENSAGISKPEKQPDPSSENSLKKSSAPPVCASENKVQLKMPTSTSAVMVRMDSQEATCMEKEMRTSPSLPISVCSPAEPPWLSLAKKKAKAWSEMPQMVQ